MSEQRIMRVISAGPNDVVFADPGNILNTLRVKTSRNMRSVADQQLPAVRVEFISARNEPVTLCDATCTVPVASSVRIQLSGVLISKATLKQQLTDAYNSALLAIDTDKVLDGFPASPATAYVIDSTV